VGKLYGKSN
jgi:serine/threonine protein kinase